MEIKTTIARLGAISFTNAKTPVAPLIDQLYVKKPERGGTKVAYRIAALRAAVLRLLGPDSAYEATRAKLFDEHYESPSELEARQKAFIEQHQAAIKAGQLSPPDERQPKNVESAEAYKAALDELHATEVVFNGELVSLEQLDAAGYPLSPIEIDALMGLLIQPEPVNA